jgi:hypothetical protein
MVHVPFENESIDPLQNGAIYVFFAIRNCEIDLYIYYNTQCRLFVGLKIGLIRMIRLYFGRTLIAHNAGFLLD